MTFLAAAVAFALWAVLATTACLAMHRARQAQTPTPEPDAEWLDVWSTDHPSVYGLDVDAVRALLSEPQSKEQIDRRCHEILAIEGLSS